MKHLKKFNEYFEFQNEEIWIERPTSGMAKRALLGAGIIAAAVTATIALHPDDITKTDKQGNKVELHVGDILIGKVIYLEKREGRGKTPIDNYIIRLICNDGSRININTGLIPHFHEGDTIKLVLKKSKNFMWGSELPTDLYKDGTTKRIER